MQLLITACLRLVYTIQIFFIQLLIYKGNNEREITDFSSAVQIHSSHLFISLWKLFSFHFGTAQWLKKKKKKSICSEYSLVCLSDISANFILPIELGILKIFNLGFSALFRWGNNQRSISLLSFNSIPWSLSALPEHAILQNKCSQLPNLLY